MAAPSDATTGSEEIASVVGSLQTTFDGIQRTFSSASSSLASNLAKSVSALQSMNALMEQFLQASLQLSTTVTAADPGSPASITVVLNVSNAGPVPVADVTLQLCVRARQVSTPAALQVLAVDGNPTSQATLEVFELPLGTVAARAAPRSIRLDLGLPALTQFNAEFKALFVSPGTGTQLQSVHHVGLYLVDQCPCDFVAPAPAAPDDNTLGQPQKLSAAAFRRVCRVRAVDGIPVGSDIVFRNRRDGSAVARLALQGTADDGAAVLVQPRAADLAPVILAELVQLCT